MNWGRAKRGKVWHALQPVGEMAMCGQDDLREITEGLPPRGANVCHGCHHEVTVYADAVRIAIQQSHYADEAAELADAPYLRAETLEDVVEYLGLVPPLDNTDMRD